MGPVGTSWFMATTDPTLSPDSDPTHLLGEQSSPHHAAQTLTGPDPIAGTPLQQQTSAGFSFLGLGIALLLGALVYWLGRAWRRRMSVMRREW